MPDENDETPIERRRRLSRERKSRWLARQSQATLDRLREENREHLRSQRAEIRASQQIENEAIQINLEPDQRGLSVSEIESPSCGSLESICQYCQALHFRSEKLSCGSFNSCWHIGKVKLPARRTFPPFSQDIMSDPNSPDYRNFHENIRSYNSAISFASMGAKLSASVPGRGPYRFLGARTNLSSHFSLTPSTR